MKKELISKCALEVFARDGYYNAKMKDIAKEAGIAVGTIYIYFTGKKEILDYIYEQEYERDNQYFNALEKEDISAVSKIKKYILYKYDCVQENPNITKVIMQDLIPVHKGESSIIIHFFILIARLADLIRQGMYDGEVKESNASLFAFLLFRSVQEISRMQLTFGLTESNEKTKEILIDFYMQGMLVNRI